MPAPFRPARPSGDAGAFAADGRDNSQDAQPLAAPAVRAPFATGQHRTRPAAAPSPRRAGQAGSISDEATDQHSGAFLARQGALSAILTALCRIGLRTAPLHAFSAPTMGTGKSLLADIVSIIATGRAAAVMSQGKNEEEDEKRLLSVLMQGDPIIVVDNVDRPIQGDALCSILTQET